MTPNRTDEILATICALCDEREKTTDTLFEQPGPITREFDEAYQTYCILNDTRIRLRAMIENIAMQHEDR